MRLLRLYAVVAMLDLRDRFWLACYRLWNVEQAESLEGAYSRIGWVARWQVKIFNAKHESWAGLLLAKEEICRVTKHLWKARAEIGPEAGYEDFLCRRCQAHQQTIYY